MSTHAFEVEGDQCPFVPVFGAPQVMFVRGSGTQVWDSNGNRYLDFLCGLAVTSLGHANPVVTAAITNQAQTLMHVSNLFANDTATEAAQLINTMLADATGFSGQTFFCNSGAEANEAALKLARKYGGRGRHAVVSAYGSFHGRTLAALAATGQPSKHEPFFPMPDGFRYAAYGEIEGLRALIDPTVGAVILETVQGEGGVVVAPDGYLQAVRELCDERGMLMIIDEVQTGFGRTGRWFGFEHHGVSPDVVTMAKAMGNGFPVGAMWARTEVAAAFRPGDHGSTYSGSALAGAVVRAVLGELQRLDAPSIVAAKGAYLMAALEAIPSIATVRGQGLLIAAELQDGIDAKQVYSDLLARGVITNAVTATALRIAPPFTVTYGEIDEAVSVLGEVLA
jgi:acetylornithine/N-succinyldiaminopimelate aminotransferase